MTEASRELSWDEATVPVEACESSDAKESDSGPASETMLEMMMDTSVGTAVSPAFVGVLAENALAEVALLTKQAEQPAKRHSWRATMRPCPLFSRVSCV